MKGIPPGARRWIPLASIILLGVSHVLRQLGKGDAANLVEALTGIAGWNSPENVMIAGAVGGALWKVWAIHLEANATEHLKTMTPADKFAATKEVLSEKPSALLTAPAATPPAADVKAVRDLLRPKE